MNWQNRIQHTSEVEAGERQTSRNTLSQANQTTIDSTQSFLHSLNSDDAKRSDVARGDNKLVSNGDASFPNDGLQINAECRSALRDLPEIAVGGTSFVSSATKEQSSQAAFEAGTPQANGSLPNSAEVASELKRANHNRRFKRVFIGTVGLFVFAAAVALVVANLWLPIMRTYGKSMEPTIEGGDLVVVAKLDSYKTGDVIAFYFNNKIQIKRVIAHGKDVVDISEKGEISVNGEVLSNQYTDNLLGGECNITLPYTVPDEQLFVVGDNRSESLDSRSLIIGCVAQDQIIGKVILRMWPFERIGFVE